MCQAYVLKKYLKVTGFAQSVENLKVKQKSSVLLFIGGVTLLYGVKMLMLTNYVVF